MSERCTTAREVMMPVASQERKWKLDGATRPGLGTAFDPVQYADVCKLGNYPVQECLAYKDAIARNRAPLVVIVIVIVIVRFMTMYPLQGPVKKVRTNKIPGIR